MLLCSGPVALPSSVLPVFIPYLKMLRFPTPRNSIVLKFLFKSASPHLFCIFISVFYLIIQSMHIIHCLLSQTTSHLFLPLHTNPHSVFCCFDFVLKPTRLNQAWSHGHGHGVIHWSMGNLSVLSSYMTETVTLPSVASKSQQFLRRNRTPWPWMDVGRPSLMQPMSKQW